MCVASVAQVPVYKEISKFLIGHLYLLFDNFLYIIYDNHILTFLLIFSVIFFSPLFSFIFFFIIVASQYLLGVFFKS